MTNVYRTGELNGTYCSNERDVMKETYDAILLSIKGLADSAGKANSIKEKIEIINAAVDAWNALECLDEEE
jgi:2,3-bisphosphoglycerate-independent phosphoglycerate mutase